MKIRTLTEPEPFDHQAVSSNPSHMGVEPEHLRVGERGLVWTCSPYALEPPSDDKCSARFSIEGEEPMVPKGWQWSEAAGVVNYTCPAHRIPTPEPKVEPEPDHPGPCKTCGKDPRTPHGVPIHCYYCAEHMGIPPIVVLRGGRYYCGKCQTSEEAKLIDSLRLRIKAVLEKVQGTHTLGPALGWLDDLDYLVTGRRR